MEETCLLKFADPEDLEDLLHDLEMAFEVRFVQSDVDQLHTVGDLYDLLQLKMGTALQNPQRCLSAVSFHRLKRAVADQSGIRVGPRTQICDVFAARTLPAQMAALGEQTGLRLPGVAFAPEQGLLFLLGAASCIAAFYFDLTTRAGIISFLVALGFVCVLRVAKFSRSMPQQTFGDLARDTAFDNYGQLARETGAYSRTELWKVLDFVIRRNVAFDGKISRETRLA